MKPLTFWLTLLLFLIASCEKSDNNTSLDEFCKVVPDGWECVVKTKDIRDDEIPRDAPKPLAVIGYINYEIEFHHYKGLFNPSLILDIYPITQKEELIELVIDQQAFSWCIPIHYGETADYFILTSPCFINSGTFTEESNSLIDDLHDSLKSIIEAKEYEGLIHFER